jgi:hypothetical protein
MAGWSATSVPPCQRQAHMLSFRLLLAPSVPLSMPRGKLHIHYLPSPSSKLDSSPRPQCPRNFAAHLSTMRTFLPASCSLSRHYKHTNKHQFPFPYPYPSRRNLSRTNAAPPLRLQPLLPLIFRIRPAFIIVHEGPAWKSSYPF